MLESDKIIKISLYHTQFEWNVLESLAGGSEKKLRAWINIHLHNLCDNTRKDNSLIYCQDCPKERRSFSIPRHLAEGIEFLADRYGSPKAALIDKFIIAPAMDMHFKTYGY